MIYFLMIQKYLPTFYIIIELLIIASKDGAYLLRIVSIFSK